MKNSLSQLNDESLVKALTNEQLFKTVIFVLAYRLNKYQQEVEVAEEFWGSEEDLALENFAYFGTNKLMGFDINEDEIWGRYLIKATSCEICQFSIEKLIEHFPEYVPISNKLFIVSLENSNIDEWASIIRQQPDMFVFFDDKQVTIGCGWDRLEEEAISCLKAKHALLSFGDFDHNIIRLKHSNSRK
jgi:hypothetical protein